jgi:iron(III) transport system substrate-binding protein
MHADDSKGVRIDRRRFVLGACALAASNRHASAQTGDAAAFRNLIEAARREGSVVVDGPPNDQVREALSSGFKARYGINVSYISSGSSRSGARVRAERAAGRYLLDVFISGPETSLVTFLGSGWLDPVSTALVDPEVMDVTKWQDGHLWYVDPQQYIIRTLRFVTPSLVVNSKLVAPGEITSWRSILDSKWRGKFIAKDPSTPGAGASLVSYFYLTFGPEFVKTLYVDQKPTISRDPRQAAQSLASGNVPFWVGPDQNEIIRFQKLGYSLDWVEPTDGPGVLSGGFGFVNLVNRAPNPNAAKLFINWLLSREGQYVFAKAINSPSLRKDVDHSWAAGYTLPRDDRQYLDTYDYKFILEHRDPAYEKAQKLLGL